MSISTAHRLTAELTSWRLLERTPDGLYRAGLPLRMMAGCPDRTPTLQERAPCVLEDLAAATRCRARLGVLQELEVSYIEKQPGHGPVTSFNPAATLPAHPTALGRALLAFSPPGVVDMTIMRGLRPYTAHTVTSPDRFRRALTVRDLGASLQSMLAVLTIAARSLTRELAGQPHHPGADAAMDTPAPALVVSAGS